MEAMEVDGRAWRGETGGGWGEILLDHDAVAGAEEDGIEHQRYN